MKNNFASSTIALLLAGTGTAYPLDATQEWQQFVQSRTQLVFEEINHSYTHIDIRTSIEHLQNIRAVLNPSISELATLFEVSRQAIYKWLSADSIPEEDKRGRITELSKIADAFKEAGLRGGGVLLNMKLFQGLSLIDLLRTRRPHERQVQELIAEAKMMETAYQQSGLMNSTTKPTSDWLSAVSLPAHHEES